MQHTYFLLAVLAFILSFQTGSTLECYSCVGTCTEKIKTKCLIEGLQCASSTYKQENMEISFKGCIIKEACDQPFTANGQSVGKVKCCSKDLCNSAFSNAMSLGTAVLLPLVSLYLSHF